MSDPSAPSPVATDAPGRAVVLPDGWTASVTDKIVTTVDRVASKTAKPITLVARGLVYGLIVGTSGVIALVLLLALVLRALVILLGFIPIVDDRAGRPVWIVYLLIGGLLLGASTWLFGKARRPTQDDDRD